MVTKAGEAGLSSVAIGGIRWLLLASLMQILLQVKWFRGVTGAVALSRKDWLLGFVLGLLLFGPAHLLYYTSMKLTDSVSGNVLLSTFPIWTSIFAFFFLKEKVPPIRLLAIGLSFMGAYVVAIGFSLPVFKGNTVGNLMFLSGVIVESLLSALAINIARRTSGVTVLSAQMWGGALTFVIAAILFSKALPLAFPTNSAQYLGAILPMLYLIILCGIVTFTIYYRIAEKTPITLLVVGIALQIPVSALIAWAADGAKPTNQTWIGAGIMIVALVVGFLVPSGSSGLTEEPDALS
jgi:drug/metabolite transporter (DMT)-like permease